MATVTITTRHRKDGPRYVVRYLVGRVRLFTLARSRR